jgi:hypothetical protein
MMQKLKHQDVQNFCSWFLLPRRAHSGLCNQSGGEKHGQKGKRDWYFNKCIVPYMAIITIIAQVDEMQNNLEKISLKGVLTKG